MQISHETKRAKRVIVELVRQAGGQIQNKTSLFLAFWKAHLHYAANSPGYLSNWPIIRTPHGPAIAEFDELLSEMLHDGWLTIGEAQVGDRRTMVFSLGPHCPPPALPKDAMESIRDGVKFTATDEESFRKSRVWRETKDGEEMEIYLDLMDDAERDQREANLAALAKAIGMAYETSRK